MSSTSMISCTFTGMRVAGNLSYFPGYVKADGKHVDQRVIIPAYANFYSPTDSIPSKKFSFVMWGRMAETMCRSLSPGREFSVVNATAEPYDKPKKHSNGQVAVDMVTGTPLMETETNYKVEPGCLTFSREESDKFVAEQKQTGHRPMQWNNSAHPDSQTWSQLKVLRNSEIWDGESAEFGFAKVFVAKIPGIKIDKMTEKAVRTARDTALATAPALDMNMLAVMIKEAVKADREAQQAALSSTPSPSPFNSDYTAMGEPKSLFTEILAQLPQDLPAPPAPQTEDVNLF